MAPLAALGPASTAPAGVVSPPVLVGSVDTPGSAFDVALVDHYALVPDYDAGLEIIDISDPAAPTIVTVHNTPGNAIQCALFGSRVAVADHVGGLAIVDVTDPAHPFRLGGFAGSSATLGVAVEGEVVLAGYATGGFNLLDLSDPGKPSLLQSVSTDGPPRHALFRDGLLYVADQEFGLRIYDVTTITAPVLIGTAPFFRPTGLDLSGTTIVVADADQLHLYDVSDPTAPGLLGRTLLPGPPVKVRIAGDYAVVADHVAGGLQVVDISDPRHPVPVAGYPTGFYSYGIAVRGTLAYLADGAGGFKVFQVFEEPVSTVGKTLGGVKALYRGDR